MDVHGKPGRYSTGTCPTGKRRYELKRDAVAARRRNRKKKHSAGADRRLSVYRCELCKGFHLGRLPADVVKGKVGRDEIRRPRRKDAS